MRVDSSRAVAQTSTPRTWVRRSSESLKTWIERASSSRRQLWERASLGFQDQFWRLCPNLALRRFHGSLHSRKETCRSSSRTQHWQGSRMSWGLRAKCLAASARKMVSVKSTQSSSPRSKLWWNFWRSRLQSLPKTKNPSKKTSIL